MIVHQGIYRDAERRRRYRALSVAAHHGAFDARPDAEGSSRVRRLLRAVSAAVRRSAARARWRERDGDSWRSSATARAIVMRGNGAVAVGASLEEAVVMAWYLEDAARVELAVLGAGVDGLELTPD